MHASGTHPTAGSLELDLAGREWGECYPNCHHLGRVALRPRNMDGSCICSGWNQAGHRSLQGTRLTSPKLILQQRASHSPDVMQPMCQLGLVRQRCRGARERCRLAEPTLQRPNSRLYFNSVSRSSLDTAKFEKCCRKPSLSNLTAEESLVELKKL